MSWSQKFAVMVGILLLGVYIGVHTVDKNMEKWQPVQETKQQVRHITKIDQGKVSYAPIRQNAKEPAQASNFVSNTGLAIGSWVKQVTKQTVGWVEGFFQP